MTSTHQSIQRAMAILRVFSEREPEIGVGEIARRLGLHKSTVSRIMATLLDDGFVWHNPDTGKYSLGMAIVELAGVALGQIDVRAAAMPHMEALGRALDETVSVSVLRHGEAVTVAHHPSTQPVRHVAWIGRRTPLETTAAGRVFLAAHYAPEHDAVPFAGAAAPGADTAPVHGPTAPAVAQVRHDGYAVEVDEHEPGTSAVAAPIVDRHGTVIASLAVAAPSFRFGPDRIRAAGPQVVAAADAVAEQLGIRRALDREDVQL